jgi:hypothetical protein
VHECAYAPERFVPARLLIRKCCSVAASGGEGTAKCRVSEERIPIMKVRLKEEMETLLIPLYGRAQMSRRGLFSDKQAEEAVRQIDYDFSRLR